MLLADELVAVGGLGLVEGRQGEGVDDEQVQVDHPAHLGFGGIVQPGGFEQAEQPVGAGESDSALAADDGLVETGLTERNSEFGHPRSLSIRDGL
jgi:hypothetical protein